MSSSKIVNGQSVVPLAQNRENSTYQTDKKQVFIIGSKGIPAAYGGFETFVEMLTRLQQNQNIRYHVARMGIDTSTMAQSALTSTYLPLVRQRRFITILRR